MSPNAPTKTRARYWRSQREHEAMSAPDAHDEVLDLVHREFPSQVGEMLDPVSRRGFMKYMGASMALAGLSNCARQPAEEIIPYVKQPEEALPGKAQYFATAMPLSGYGMGLVAASYDGRPTKLEGLAEHPSSRGATGLHAQTSILDMYDPDRLDTVTYQGNINTWNTFVVSIAAELNRVSDIDGSGVHILCETMTSPTLAWQMKRLRAAYPNVKWRQYEPASAHGAREGALMAFGKYVDTLYDFTRAEVVLSLDANFLTEGPGHVRHAQDFAATRDAENNDGKMSRLYVAEPTPTLTGASADHKTTLRYPGIETLARAVASRIGVPGVEVDDGALSTLPAPWVDALVSDLESHKGRGIVVAGNQQPGVVHALAHAINAQLGNVSDDGPVTHIESVEFAPTDQRASLAGLVEDMKAGKVKILLILGGNPVYNTPPALDFAGALEHVGFRAHLSIASNETSNLCHWVIPEAHYLEAWSDVRGHDGTTSIIQPLIAPLYGGKTVHEMLAALFADDVVASHDIVQVAWRAKRGEDGFKKFWRAALSKGIIEGTASPPARVTPKGNFPKHAYAKKATNLDILFRLDPHVYDGRFANNGWLQELAKPLTKVTWENAIYLHPQTAKALDLRHEDLVELSHNGQKVHGPVLYQLDHPKNAVTVHLGYGRTRAGAVGDGIGFNAYTLQDPASPWFGVDASIHKMGRRHQVARTEEHYNIEQSLRSQGEKAEDRHLIRQATLAEFNKKSEDGEYINRDFAQHMGHQFDAATFTLYDPEEKKYDGYAWGMSIDLNKCTGCSVCVMACQAENNIPVVGKDQVMRGREMQWIRIDRYYTGDFDGGQTETGDDALHAVHQPLPCMQCENAPCEPVCPVGATSHSREGLNDMIYNRCVGTRYCSNNCPYKVRRFNYFKYADHSTPQLKMMRNPNVTVRGRGVMEKCTYCVQRINIARIDAKREGRAINDGEIVTACQAACPSRAILFGDQSNPKSKVSLAKASPRDYALLGDVGTRPRTTYLAKLSNPSPALAPAGGEQPSEH